MYPIKQHKVPRKLKALFLEDNPRDAKLYARCLADAGFEVQAEVVVTRDEFAVALSRASYDIILADHGLPGWSGISALDVLHQSGVDVPFIFISGSVEDDVAVECVKRGATDYILKDRLARLPHAVERALLEREVQRERRKTERSRDLLASLVESSGEAIVGIALDGAILSWNRGASSIFGYSAEEAAGQPISLLFAFENAGTAAEILGALERGATSDPFECAGSRKDGAKIDVAVSVSLIRPPGDDPGVACVIVRDITAFKRLQAQFLFAQKMEAVGRLAAAVAHDFNNMLTIVSNCSAMALSELPPDHSAAIALQQIEEACEHASGLTRQLLVFSKQQALEPRVIDLNQIVAGMDGMLRRVGGVNITLTTVLDPALRKVLVDPGQMVQVIMNLAMNARDAMTSGGSLTIQTANTDFADALSQGHVTIRPGAYAMLAVTDTGCGMDAETAAHIFEPFFTTKGERGTGLGLSTVYGIVDQSGGAVLVSSSPGEGTTFRIFLPAAET